MMTTYELAGCPVCAARGTELLADEEGIRDEIEALWGYHLTHGCIALSDAELIDRLQFTQQPPLAVLRCIGCGLLYRNPRERFIRELYEHERHDDRQLDALLAVQRDAFRLPVERLTSLHGGCGTGLEVGSYVGAFLDSAAAAGWQFTAVDVNPAVVAYLQRRGHAVFRAGIEDAPRPAAGYDVVACWNCFDQLPDPLRAARAARERLRQHGLLALRVPNGEFYAHLRRHLHGIMAQPTTAMLARHNFLGFPYRFGFTLRSLRLLLATAGFQLIEVHAAALLPLPGVERHARDRLLDAAELALRPVVGAPWLEVYARRT